MRLLGSQAAPDPGISRVPSTGVSNLPRKRVCSHGQSPPERNRHATRRVLLLLCLIPLVPRGLRGQDLKIATTTVAPTVLFANEPITLTFSITGGTSFRLTDYLPALATFTSTGSTTGCTSTDSGTVVTCTGNVASTKVVFTTPRGTFTNVAGVLGPSVEADITNNSKVSTFNVYLRGDANNDGAVTVGDVFFLINYLFAGGPPPIVTGLADANHDAATDVADIFFLINYLYAGGPAPSGAASQGAAATTATCQPTDPCGPPPPPGGDYDSDVLTVASVSANHRVNSVRVPIYVKDKPKSPIGMDLPAGYRINALAVQVLYGTNTCISSASFDDSTGILSTLVTSGNYFLRTNGGVQGQGAIGYVFSTSDGAIPFTTASGGDKIGDVVFALTGCSATTIALPVSTSGPLRTGLSCTKCSTFAETGASYLALVPGQLTLK
jgi:hypothetical protein